MHAYESQVLPYWLYSCFSLEATVTEGIIGKCQLGNGEAASRKPTDDLNLVARPVYIHGGRGGVSSISPGRRNGGRSTDPGTRQRSTTPGTQTQRPLGRSGLLCFWPRGNGECRDTFCIATAPSGLSLRLDRRMCLVGQGLFPSA